MTCQCLKNFYQPSARKMDVNFPALLGNYGGQDEYKEVVLPITNFAYNRSLVWIVEILMCYERMSV